MQTMWVLRTTVGLLLVFALVAAQDHTHSAVDVKEESTPSAAPAQHYAAEQFGADARRHKKHHHHDHHETHSPQVPDEYDDENTYKGYKPGAGSQAPKAADSVGQTYMMSTFRRVLSRPASTTLRQLAEATPPLNLASARSGPEQQLESRQGVKAVRRHSGRPRAQNTAAAKGTVQPAAPASAKLVPASGPGQAAASTSDYGTPTAEAVLSFNGLNAFDQRFANGGNQYTIIPPDQALCVGGGYVLAGVNTVLQVYDAATGQPKLANQLDLNTFYGFPAQLNRTSNIDGPDLTDPGCAFDQHTQRWFFVVTALPAQRPPGPNVTSVELAVSDGPDPTGSWSYYSIPGTNNGNQGTPNFGCSSGTCLPDFPQMAIWEHAVVITANVFDLFADEYISAAVYAVDKAALIAGASKANTALVRTTTADTDLSVNTLIPATQVGHCSTPNTYLMATSVVFGACLTCSFNTLILFSLQGTETLASQHARVTLDWVNREVELDITYARPPNGTQKFGDIPLGNVEYNITTTNLLDPLDARMTSVSFVDDKLYCAWGTALQDEVGAAVAGVAWALVDPHSPQHALKSSLLGATGGNHLLFPYLAVRPGGLGVMAVTISGPDYYPTAAFLTLTQQGLGQLTVAAAGVGPLDTFAGYESADRVDRFGDYASARVDEHGDFWIASEYVAQTCTVEQFLQPTPIVGVCGKTRAPFANWATRITKVHWDSE